MSKHTPGPWSYEVKKDQRYCSQTGKHLYDTTMVRVWGLDQKFIGCLNHDEAGEANARLIAAAPELLEIVKLILKEWEAPNEGLQRGELIARLCQYATEARSVIAKAEGA